MALSKTSTRTKFFFGFIILSLVIIFGIFAVSKKNLAKETSACGAENLEAEVFSKVGYGYIDGERVKVPNLALNAGGSNVLGVTDISNRWIEVDLSEQKLKAWDGDQLYLETLVSSGLPWFPTPTGEFRIWAKMRATRMKGGEGKYYYDLPNVPFVMFFENTSVPGYRGYGLHGTYWHNDFGRVHSHGCVNLPTSVAEKLYYWTGPVMPEGKYFVRSSDDNPGTRIVIHE